MTATSVKNQTKKLSCWAVLWIVVLSMTALALCMFKVPPLMGDLIAALNLSGTAGAHDFPLRLFRHCLYRHASLPH